MKVWLITDGEPLPVMRDAIPFRTWRAATALAQCSHEVTWWATTFSHAHKTLVRDSDATIAFADKQTLRLVHAGSYESNHSLARYHHHTRFAKRFRLLARESPRPDIIVAAMPIHHVALEAVIFGMRFGIPVIVDLRDMWPDIFLELFPKALRPVARVLLHKEFRVMRRLCQGATALISMMESILAWGLTTYTSRERTWRDKVFYLGGDETPPASDNDMGSLPVAPEELRGRFVVNYIGSFGKYNNPLVMIRAAEYIARLGHNRIVFLLAGKGDYSRQAEEAAKNLSNVRLLGWLAPRQLAALNHVSDVGVIPWAQGYAFPNKAFSYLGAGLPVISSAGGDLANLLRANHAGFSYAPGNHVELAKCILRMADPQLGQYREYSLNARTLFQKHLKADRIYEEYADHVCRVASEAKSP